MMDSVLSIKALSDGHIIILFSMQIRTVEALITDTLLSGQLYLRLPSQFPVFLNSNTNSANFTFL